MDEYRKPYRVTHWVRGKDRHGNEFKLGPYVSVRDAQDSASRLEAVCLWAGPWQDVEERKVVGSETLGTATVEINADTSQIDAALARVHRSLDGLGERMTRLADALQ